MRVIRARNGFGRTLVPKQIGLALSIGILRYGDFRKRLGSVEETRMERLANGSMDGGDRKMAINGGRA